MMCRLCLPVAEATDGGVKCFVGVSVKVSPLEGPGCWLSTSGFLLSFHCHLALLGWLDDLACWHLSLQDG